jgi:hypothetical protein
MIVTRLPNMMDMQKIKVIWALLGVHKLNAGYDLWLFPTSRPMITSCSWRKRSQTLPDVPGDLCYLYTLSTWIFCVLWTVITRDNLSWRVQSGLWGRVTGWLQLLAQQFNIQGIRWKPSVLTLSSVKPEDWCVLLCPSTVICTPWETTQSSLQRCS